MTIVVKPLPRNETTEVLRKVANLVWQEKGVLRKIDYLGFKKLPYATKDRGAECTAREGDYFVYHMSLPQLRYREIFPKLKLDLDILKTACYAKDDTDFHKDYQCTLEEELQIPFHRQSVQPLLDNRNVRATVRNRQTIKKLD